MKTFSITRSQNGNILVIDHHSKPRKTVKIYNSDGQFLNDINEQSFNTVSYFQGACNAKGKTMQDAVNSSVRIRENNENKRLEALRNEKYGVYAVLLSIIPLEGSAYYKTVKINACGSERAQVLAASQYWLSPKWDTVKTICEHVDFIK